MKYQSISDENFSLKRDLIFLEKEIKNKSELIDRLRNELLETNKKSFTNDYYKYGEQSNSTDKNNYNSNYNSEYSTNKNSSNKVNEYYSKVNDKNNKQTTENKDSKINNNNNSINKNINVNKKNYYNDSVTNSLNILPSQLNVIKNENKVLDCENKLLKVQKERDQVIDYLSQIQIELEKLPEFPKTKVQILKKKNLEVNITDYNKEILKMRLDIKELNALNKD